MYTKEQREKRNAQQRARRSAVPWKFRESERRYDAKRNKTPHRREQKKRESLRKLYGMTLEEWGRRFAEQNGLCAICRKRPADCVDHSHVTGAVRGLLCQRCNKGIGLLGDDPDTALSASEYLRNS